MDEINEPIIDCFDKATSVQPIRVKAPVFLDYSVEIEIENVIVNPGTEKSLQRRFGGLDVKVRMHPGTSRVTLIVPRIDLPRSISGIDHLNFLLTNKTEGLWLGANSHGPEFIGLESIVHIGIVGGSGYGKTACLRSLLAQLAFVQEEVLIGVIDPKSGSDYLFLENSANIISVARSLSEWQSLLSAMTIEIAAREHLFSTMSSVPPNNLSDYSKMSANRTDNLPALKRIFICIDEAFMLFNSGHHHPLLNGLVDFIARKGRAYGIHLIFSSQRSSDIPGSARAQINKWISFFSSDPNNLFWLNVTGSSNEHGITKKAISGRGHIHDFEFNEIREFQATYFGSQDILTLASTVQNKKSTKGFVPLKLHHELLDNADLAKGILQGNSLEALANTSALIDRTWANEKFAFCLPNFYEVIADEPKLTTSEISEMVHEKDEHVEPVRRSTLHLPKYLRIDNKPKDTDLKAKYSIALKESKANLFWARRDLSSNPGLMEFNSLAEGSHDEGVFEYRDLILPDDVVQQVKDFSEQFARALKIKEAPPLLVISGGAGLGKKTFLRALALMLKTRLVPVETNLVDDPNNVCDSPKPRILEFKSLRVLQEQISRRAKSLDGLALILEIDPDESSILSDIIEIRKIGAHFIHVHLAEEKYARPEIFSRLIKLFFLKYGFIEDAGLPTLSDLMAEGIRISPATISALARRAGQWAMAKGLRFDAESLRALFREDRRSFPLGNRGPVEVVSPGKSLMDFVLPIPLLEQVQSAISNIKSLYENQYSFEYRLKRKRNCCVLAGGPPGVGKSLVAEVIAYETRRPLWICDFGRLQSCFVGQTEAILSKIFDEAESEGAVLLLDECDAFLRSRSESGNSVYLNMVTSHLLTLIDNFGGVLILTTNFPQALDPAVSRRCNFKLFLNPPDKDGMVRIMKTILEPDAPLESNIDLVGLFDGVQLAGGLIRLAIERAILKMRYLKSPFLTAAILREALIGVQLENEIVTGSPKRTVSLNTFGDY